MLTYVAITLFINARMCIEGELSWYLLGSVSDPDSLNRDQVLVNPDPDLDPGFDDQKFTKNTVKKSNFLKKKKNTIFL